MGKLRHTDKNGCHIRYQRQKFIYKTSLTALHIFHYCTVMLFLLQGGLTNPFLNISHYTLL